MRERDTSVNFQTTWIPFLRVDLFVYTKQFMADMILTSSSYEQRKRYAITTHLMGN